MLSDEVKIELSKFAKAVIKSSRSNLTRKGKNASKELYRSLDFDLNVTKNSFSLAFLMEAYGKFQDEGVRGKDPSKVRRGDRTKRGQQAPNSRYRFGSGSHKGTWGKFVNNIEKWVKKRGYRLRDDKGRFKEGTYKTMAQIIASNIYFRGIAPSMFFTKPFEAAFKRLPDDLIEKFGLDLEDFLTFTTNNLPDGN